MTPPGLGGAAGLVDLGAGGGVALGRVGQRLLRGVVRADEVEHLAAEPLHPAARVGLRVVQLARLGRLMLADQPEPARDDGHDHQQGHDRTHVSSHSSVPAPCPASEQRASGTERSRCGTGLIRFLTRRSGYPRGRARSQAHRVLDVRHGRRAGPRGQAHPRRRHVHRAAAGHRDTVPRAHQQLDLHPARPAVPAAQHAASTSRSRRSGPRRWRPRPSSTTSAPRAAPTSSARPG